MSLGEDVTLDDLRREFDAVFMGIGLGRVNDLGIDHENDDGVLNAVDFIAELRQADDKGSLPVGRRVIVVGGGMTAVDIAVQCKRLGADRVQIVYRRGPENMGASQYEQEFAQTSGVTIRHWATPVKLETKDGVIHVLFESTKLDDSGMLVTTGEPWPADADVVFKAVGQAIDRDTLGDTADSIEQLGGKLMVNEERRTSLHDVWAGGDCVYGHDDLTVTAVQDGKVAALSIDRHLRASEAGNG